MMKIFCDNGNEPLQYKIVKIPKTSKDLQNKLDGKLLRVAKAIDVPPRTN